MTMQMIQGSLEPAVEISLTDGEGDPVPLGDADSVWLRAELHGQELFREQITGSTNNGIVVYPWAEGDTATPGRIWFDVLVVWPGSREQWFRAADVADIEPL